MFGQALSLGFLFWSAVSKHGKEGMHQKKRAGGQNGKGVE